MSLKFLAPPAHRAPVAQPHRQVSAARRAPAARPAPAVEADLTPTQTAALDSYQTRCVTILRAGAVRVQCCAPTPAHLSTGK